MQRPGPGHGGDGRAVLAWRVVLALALVGGWEAAGRWWVGPTWISQPTLILARLATWSGGALPAHAGTTLAEMLLGCAIGMPLGVLVGFGLGRSAVLAALFRPIIVALYSVPLIALAPLLILWFGLDMAPKIVLVSVVVFFLLFFNTFSGVQAVDRDLVAVFQLMGANRRENVRKVIAPACAAWILSGVKIALPYALVAAAVGEMLAARRGLGFLLTQSATHVDMTGLYAALVVLMVVGVLVSEAAARLERWLLRWRPGGG